MTTPGQQPRPHGGDGRFVRSPDTADRDAAACRLRRDSTPYREIADQLGYADESGARAAVKRALAATIQEPADELRQLELERLDRMYREVLAVLERQHVTVSQGKIIRRQVGYERNPTTGELERDGDGNPIPSFEDLLDDAPVLAAVDRLLKIQERRARYLGLDAPQRFGVDAENLGQEITELLAALGGAGDSAAA